MGGISSDEGVMRQPSPGQSCGFVQGVRCTRMTWRTAAMMLSSRVRSWDA